LAKKGEKKPILKKEKSNAPNLQRNVHRQKKALERVGGRGKKHNIYGNKLPHDGPNRTSLTAMGEPSKKKERDDKTTESSAFHTSIYDVTKQQETTTPP